MICSAATFSYLQCSVILLWRDVGISAAERAYKSILLESMHETLINIILCRCLAIKLSLLFIYMNSLCYIVLFSDITYSILFEAVTVLLVFFSYQLFHKDILRDGIIYQHIMKGRWWGNALAHTPLKTTLNLKCPY